MFIFSIGSVEFTTQKAIKIKGLRLIIKGKTKVSWQESNALYSGLEKHLKNHTQLIVCDSQEAQEISAGIHTFKFSCQIPESAPATVVVSEGGFSKSFIQYKVKVRLDVPSIRKVGVEREFTVKRELDLNTIPGIDKIGNFQEILQLRNICCKTKQVEIKVKLPKFRYALMEKIPFTIEVVGVVIGEKFPVKKVQIKLKRIMILLSQKPIEKHTIDVKTEVKTLIPFVLEGDFLRIHGSIEVPETCPISNLKYGKLYQYHITTYFTIFISIS